MDDGFSTRLAIAVREARGRLSQREFSKLLGVSQSSVQQWEKGDNVPSLENLEKIARMKGMLVEDFVAYLYDRTRGITSKDILDRVEVMPSKDFAQILRVMADRFAPQEEKESTEKPNHRKKPKPEKPLRLVTERQRGVSDLGE